MTRPKPLAVVGNINVDLIMGPVSPWPDPGTETIVNDSALRHGGAAGNVALAWRAFGREYQIASNTGQGQFGAWLRQMFAPQSDAWPISNADTTISVGLTHPDSERTFFTSRGHIEELSWPQVQTMIDWPRLAGGKLLLCGTFVCDALANDYDAIMAHARAHTVKIALDTGWPTNGWTPETITRVRVWLGQCDCLLLNEAETKALSGGCAPDQAPAALLPLMPAGAVVVVKCGATGAVAQADGGPLLRAPAPAVKVLDSIGAGDIFNAAFLAAWSDGMTLATCLEWGVNSASTAISTAPRHYSIDAPLPIKGVPR
jgi:sugar/nucleoside kinase (ribokinase family)